MRRQRPSRSQSPKKRVQSGLICDIDDCDENEESPPPTPSTTSLTPSLSLPQAGTRASTRDEISESDLALLLRSGLPRLVLAKFMVSERPLHTVDSTRCLSHPGLAVSSHRRPAWVQKTPMCRACSRCHDRAARGPPLSRAAGLGIFLREPSCAEGAGVQGSTCSEHGWYSGQRVRVCHAPTRR